MPRRPVEPMPEDVRDALDARGVRADYDARPHYQRNDYLAWIRRAARAATRERRIALMLDELDRGGVYMRMPHAPSHKA